MNHSPYIEQYLLSSTALLREYLHQPLNQSITNRRQQELVYHTFRDSKTLIPDHVFTSRWAAMLQARPQQSNGSLVLHALAGLATTFISHQQAKLTIKASRFNQWQNVLSHISGLPVIAAFIAEHQLDLSRHGQLSDLLERSLGHGAILYPYHPIVEDYIQSQQLHETHVHLNGSTSAERCWLDALHCPTVSLDDFTSAFQNPKVRELVHQVDDQLNPASLKHRLNLAIMLRQLLQHFIQYDPPSIPNHLDQPGHHSIPNHLDQPGHHSIPKHFNQQLSPSRPLHHFTHFSTINHDPIEINQEILFQAQLIHKLSETPTHSTFQQAYAVYLLLFNQYLQLMVQKENQKGFDIFQKFTHTELREASEKDFRHRFTLLHGSSNKSQVGFFEGRLAPKSTQFKLHNLLKNCLRGYYQYRKGTANGLPSMPNENSELPTILKKLAQLPSDPNKLQLSLVFHFIKQPEDLKQLGEYRYSILRKTLQDHCNILLKTIDSLPLLNQWIRGIDAASNELHTPPEVFAPIFNVCKQANIQHATYHVGEDFNHLLSGIRHINDAINLLPLSTGDRLGHCTAIGIWPDQWAKQMPDSLRISREEWLLTLLFLWERFSDQAHHHHCGERSRQEAVNLANHIFADQQFLDIEQISAVMALRSVWPPFFIKAITIVKQLPGNFANKHHFDWRLLGPISFNWQKEAQKVAELIRNTHKNILLLYYRWLTDAEIRKRSADIIDVNRDFLTPQDTVILQNEILQELRDKCIIIETLPTSNIRISQYQEMKDHHIFRWLGLHSRYDQPNIDVLVALGSDDPGIFANSLVSDFYHLYQVLRDDFQLSDTNAMALLAKVNERGRIYRTHDQTAKPLATPDRHSLKKLKGTA